MDTDAEISEVEQVSTPEAIDQVDSAALRDDEVAEDEVPERPSNPEEEEKAIQKLIDIGDLEMAAGDAYFLIASRWWREWKQYTSSSTNNETSGPSAAAPPPPAIDNSILLEPGGEGFMKLELQEDDDFVIVPTSAWLALHAWYGGGPAIQKDVIRLAGGREELRVEIYPLRLRVTCRTAAVAATGVPAGLSASAPVKSNDGDVKTVTLSKRATVGELREEACRQFGVMKGTKVHLWDFFGGRHQRDLTDDSQALEDAELQMNNEILLEVLEPATTEGATAAPGVSEGATSSLMTIAGGPLSSYSDASEGSKTAIMPTPFLGAPGTNLSLGSGSNWSPIRASADSEAEGSGSAEPAAAEGPSSTAIVPLPAAPDDWTARLGARFGFGAGGGGGSGSGASSGPTGLTGLVNLGNTCFMNSALQCLVHTQPLVDYFMGDFMREINRTNPLGMEGELASSFGDLLRKLWAPSSEPVAPRAFKARLSRFAPQFSGYNQHDSQELLAFLLDGLHEDLNRVHKKPYFEAKDSDGRPDAEVAAEYWSNHMARNNSVIVDKFQGQYKSTLVCPVCAKVSVTFDPFMYLSLPLPAKTTRTLVVTVISSTGREAPRRVSLVVNRNANVGEVQRQLAAICQLAPDERLMLAETYNSRIFRVFASFVTMAAIEDRDRIVAYRLPRSCDSPIAIVQRVKEQSTVTRDYFWKLHATPLVLPVNRNAITCGADLYTLTRAALRPFLNASYVPPPKPTSATRASPSDAATSATDTDARADTQAAAPATSSLGAVRGEGEGRSSGQKENGSLPDGSQRSDSSGSLEGRAGSVGESEGDELARDKSVAMQPRDDDEPMGEELSKEDAYPFKLSTSGRFQGETPTEPITNNINDPLPRNFHSVEIVHKDLPTLVLDWSEEVGPSQEYDLSGIEEVPEAREPGKLDGGLFGRLKKESVTLASCLASFLKEEPLGPEDMWYCPRCKEHRQASKKLDLWRLPEILVVHLKRFSYSRFFKNKLDTLVEYPVKDLDLSAYLPAAQSAGQEAFRYELYAISNHFGGMGGGHYTAYGKHPNGSWYCFDDSYVSRVDESQIETSAAYVLFYKRVPAAEGSDPVSASNVGVAGKGKGLLDAIDAGNEGGADGVVTATSGVVHRVGPAVLPVAPVPRGSDSMDHDSDDA